MKTMPWRKLWRSTANDEKLRSMITRYGHECAWIWTCILTQADDSGAFKTELEDLAYLTITAPDRLTELLGVFARKGLITYGINDADYPVPLIEIDVANWTEYQQTESESAERVRRWRERQRSGASDVVIDQAQDDAADAVQFTVDEPVTKERYGNVTETARIQNSDIRIQNNIHTQNSSSREAVSKKYPEEPEGPIIPDPPMIKPQYPTLDWSSLNKNWNEIPDVPDTGGLYRLQSVYGRDLLQYFDGLSAADIYDAVENYHEVKIMPDTWWKANPDIVTWARKHLTRFLPKTFKASDYRKNTDGDRIERMVAEEQARLRAEREDAS